MNNMNRHFAIVFSMFGFLSGVVSLSLADDYTYTTIDFPGAIQSGAASINNLGQIVGGYQLSDGSRHGFLYSGGVFTTIDDPNATAGSEALGINQSGQIVGAYNLNAPEDPHSFEGAHGFLYNGGTFTDINFPGSSVTNTTPNRINDSGDIVGVYRINSGPGNGFLDVGGVFTTVNVPGKVGTHCNGNNNSGEIVGQDKDTDSGPHHGFLDNGGTFTTIDFPGAAETVAEDIDNFGNVVGAYKTTGGTEFGFLDNGGSFSTIAFPGAVATLAAGVNDNGDIVGLYQDQSEVLHGFLATPISTGSSCSASTSIAQNFNGTAIPGGSYIWFNSNFKPSKGAPVNGTTVQLIGGMISFTANNVSYSLPVPNSMITFTASVACATLSFDTVHQQWNITVPLKGSDEIFLGGLAFQAPAGGLPGGVRNVTWSGTIASSSPGLTFQWKWGAAVYSSFSNSYGSLGVKPTHQSACSYNNGDHAGTPENVKSVIGGATGGGGSNFTGSWSGTGTVVPICPGD